MTKKTVRKPLSREQILAKVHPGPERVVDVAGVGAIRVRVPSFARLIELKATCQSEDDYRLGFILASCPDLRAEDLEALRVGNGFAVAALVTAVTGLDKPLDDQEVGKH